MWVLYNTKKTRDWAAQTGNELVVLRGRLLTDVKRGRRRRARTEESEIDLVPGYVFCERMPVGGWTTPGVARDAHGSVLSVSREDLRLVQELWNASQAEAAACSGSDSSPPDLSSGCSVVISGGPFDSMRGSVVSVSGDRVSVQIEGFPVPVSMSSAICTTP